MRCLRTRQQARSCCVDCALRAGSRRPPAVKRLPARFRSLSIRRRIRHPSLAALYSILGGERSHCRVPPGVSPGRGGRQVIQQGRCISPASPQRPLAGKPGALAAASRQCRSHRWGSPRLRQSQYHHHPRFQTGSIFNAVACPAILLSLPVGGKAKCLTGHAWCLTQVEGSLIHATQRQSTALGLAGAQTGSVGKAGATGSLVLMLFLLPSH